MLLYTVLIYFYTGVMIYVFYVLPAKLGLIQSVFAKKDDQELLGEDQLNIPLLRGNTTTNFIDAMDAFDEFFDSKVQQNLAETHNAFSLNDAKEPRSQTAADDDDKSHKSFEDALLEHEDNHDMAILKGEHRPSHALGGRMQRRTANKQSDLKLRHQQSLENYDFDP